MTPRRSSSAAKVEPEVAPEASVDIASQEIETEPAVQVLGHVDATPDMQEPEAKRLVMDHNPYKFLGWNKIAAQCRVRVFAGRRAATALVPDMVVIITQFADDPDATVTNNFAQLATLLLPELMPKPELEYRKHIVWIEHCEDHDTFDAVTFQAYDNHGPYYARNKWGTGYSGLYWHRITRSEVADLLGGGVRL
jgi:hypothetical protein